MIVRSSAVIILTVIEMFLPHLRVNLDYRLTLYVLIFFFRMKTL